MRRLGARRCRSDGGGPRHVLVRHRGRGRALRAARPAVPDDPRRLHRRLCPAGRRARPGRGRSPPDDGGLADRAARRRPWRLSTTCRRSTSRRSSSSCASGSPSRPSRLQREPTGSPRSPTSASSRRGPPAEPPGCLEPPRRLYGGHVNAESGSAPRPSLLVLSGRSELAFVELHGEPLYAHALRALADAAGPVIVGVDAPDVRRVRADVARWRLSVTVLVHDEWWGTVRQDPGPRPAGPRRPLPPRHSAVPRLGREPRRREPRPRPSWRSGR